MHIPVLLCLLCFPSYPLNLEGPAEHQEQCFRYCTVLMLPTYMQFAVFYWITLAIQQDCQFSENKSATNLAVSLKGVYWYSTEMDEFFSNKWTIYLKPKLKLCYFKVIKTSTFSISRHPALSVILMYRQVLC